MARVIVRNLDEPVVSSLKFKAELHGHSLEQELREILKRAAELTRTRSSPWWIGSRRSRSDRCKTIAPI